MLVRMKTAIAGVRWSAGSGALINLEDKLAASLISRGYAEAAVLSEPENAAIRTKPIKRKKGG